ncbi:endonuclease/exonuclease/phosphatase family protein [Nocardioides sp. AX2bis]|uniref:endonuclease/exonuclease/phosphatase family protein n=1 Tax=Nocardioides sp. AX2bis TaxID=2653157 RepID=UPI0012F2724A|nr:endonuclease/exonuclease/phosphatase family protein [Nocardioides sp. AX2bis]VXC42880.1 hypothetical protein NOCARDAX2BIS_540005 [Nocardioides sp. AX2bis]
MPALLILGALLWLLALAAPSTRPPGGPDDRPVKDLKPLHLAAWNPHLGAPRDRIQAWVADTRAWADLWVLNEVGRSFAALAAIAKVFGLGHAQERPVARGAVVDERGSTAILTGPGFHRGGGRVLALARRWKVFSANRWHTGRRLQIQRGKVGGRAGWRVKVVAAHGPTNGPNGGNRDAYAEFLAVLLRALVFTRPGTVVVIAGDLNAKRADLAKWIRSPALAWLGLRMAGHNVDWCITRGADVNAERGESKRGSDHYPIRYTITPRPKRLAKIRAAITSRRRRRARK